MSGANYDNAIRQADYYRMRSVWQRIMGTYEILSGNLKEKKHSEILR